MYTPLLALQISTIIKHVNTHVSVHVPGYPCAEICVYMYMYMYVCSETPSRWTPLGPNVLSSIYSLVSFVQGLVLYHAPAASRVWRMKEGCIDKEILTHSSYM